MDTVDAAGHRIACDLKGGGPPLVLLHGYVGDRRYGGSSDPQPMTLVLAHRDPGLEARRDRGAGHVCNIDAPERFNAEVRGFLRSSQS